MSRYRVRSVGAHEDRRTVRAREAFIAIRGDEAVQARQAEIDALATVDWKGKPLRVLRCTGETGRGPHDCNVPEGLLWALIDLRCYRCAFH